MKRFQTQLLLALATLGFLALLAGCNTTEGFGEDLEQLGDQIQEDADR